MTATSEVAHSQESHLQSSPHLQAAVAALSQQPSLPQQPSEVHLAQSHSSQSHVTHSQFSQVVPSQSHDSQPQSSPQQQAAGAATAVTTVAALSQQPSLPQQPSEVHLAQSHSSQSHVTHSQFSQVVPSQSHDSQSQSSPQQQVVGVGVLEVPPAFTAYAPTRPIAKSANRVNRDFMLYFSLGVNKLNTNRNRYRRQLLPRVRYKIHRQSCSRRGEKCSSIELSCQPLVASASRSLVVLHGTASRARMLCCEPPECCSSPWLGTKGSCGFDSWQQGQWQSSVPQSSQQPDW